VEDEAFVEVVGKFHFVEVKESELEEEVQERERERERKPLRMHMTNDFE
jgi:hypothetical protein